MIDRDNLRRYLPGWVLEARRSLVGVIRGRRALGPRLGRFQPVSCLEVEAHRVPRARVPAIDVHTHLGRWLSPRGTWKVPDVAALLDQMEACNVRALVNLDGRWGQELEANLDRYDRAHPGRFATLCHLDWAETGRTGFGDRLAVSLQQSVAAGARGLKVWKDLGLSRRDDAGRLLLPDDPRLAPVWAAAAELRIPVLIHTADPVAFWRPVDRYNERFEELRRHPNLSLHDPKFPPFARLIECLESLVSANPRTIFIGAHVGCYAENLRWVDRMITTYPNFYIDIAGRLMELGRQPRAAYRLITAHPERVMFGTDIVPFDGAEYEPYFRFLETEDEYFPYSSASIPMQGRWAANGISLPDPVSARVYHDNAQAVIPGLR